MRNTSSLKSVSLTINWGGGGGVAMLTQFESDHAFYAYNLYFPFNFKSEHFIHLTTSSINQDMF